MKRFHICQEHHHTQTLMKVELKLREEISINILVFTDLFLYVVLTKKNTFKFIYDIDVFDNTDNAGTAM